MHHAWVASESRKVVSVGAVALPSADSENLSSAVHVASSVTAVLSEDAA